MTDPAFDRPVSRPPGFRSIPFRQFVLKVHSRCNLDCDYCYVYHASDQSWRQQPTVMSRQNLELTAARIAEHALSHQLPQVAVIFHGGEPLLAGSDFIRDAASTLRRALRPETELRLSLQTNATILNHAYLTELRSLGVRIGVSIDGEPAPNADRRSYHNGRSSHQEVVRGLRLLGTGEFRDSFAGVLCVIDLDRAPVATYEYLLGFGPPKMDFLLPHATWAQPPARTLGNDYGRWLAAVFDRWYSAPARETSVRMFDEVIGMFLGRPSRVETIGASPAAHLVVETDGSIEQVDALKIAYHGAAATNMHVRTHSFDAVLAFPALAVRQQGVSSLCQTCQSCEIRDVCGGGFYPHRFHPESGFDNPSVYCPDLMYFIRHVRDRISRPLEVRPPP